MSPQQDAVQQEFSETEDSGTGEYLWDLYRPHRPVKNMMYDGT